MKIALIPCACTEWLEKGRLLGRVELAPTPAGEQECCRWAEGLRTVELKQIRHSPDELATRTARALGRQLVVPTKVARGLAEVDLGLWAGLTERELKSRYASAHRELSESPLNVSPPGGESFGAADARLKDFLKKQLRRNGAAAFGLVLRPVSFAMTRCTLEGRGPSAVWEAARQPRAPVVIEFANGAALSGDQQAPTRP